MVGFEQSLLKGRDDRFARCLFALAGLGTKGLRDQLTIDDRSILRYVGLLGQRPRSAEALERCLGDYFQVPVRVNQFIGAWLKLEEADWTTIGVTGSNNILGHSALAGTKIWDQQAAFKVEVGPLEFEQFHGLLPSGKSYPNTRAADEVVRRARTGFRCATGSDELMKCRPQDFKRRMPMLRDWAGRRGSRRKNLNGMPTK